MTLRAEENNAAGLEICHNERMRVNDNIPSNCSIYNFIKDSRQHFSNVKVKLRKRTFWCSMCSLGTCSHPSCISKLSLICFFGVLSFFPLYDWPGENHTGCETEFLTL